MIGATNRPDMIDPAMVRPGRLDKLLYVDLPSQEERFEILKTLCKRIPLESEVERPDLQAVSSNKACDGFSGADLGALVREAAVTALREALPVPQYTDDGLEIQDAAAGEKKTVTIRQGHFDQAMKKVNPSVSHQQRRKYEALRNRFAGIPVGKKRSVADNEDAESKSAERIDQSLESRQEGSHGIGEE